MKTTTRSLLLTTLICIVLARVGEADISDFDGDLTAYWKLDVIDGSSDTPEEIGPYTTSVETGDANAVTVTSPGKVDDAFGFTGSGANRVKTDSTFTVGTSFSVSVWVRVGGVQSAYARIVENSYQSSFFLGNNNAGKWNFIVNYDSHSNLGLVQSVSSYVTSTNWHHLVGTYDGASTTAKLYVDNVEVDSEATIAAPGSPALNVWIGAGSAGDCWDGDIDEVRIYNRALTVGEIDDLYNNIGGGAPSPPAPSALSVTIY